MSLSDIGRRTAAILGLDLPQGPNPSLGQYLDAILLDGDLEKTKQAQRARMTLSQPAQPTATPDGAPATGPASAPAGAAPAQRAPSRLVAPPPTSLAGYSDFSAAGGPMIEPAVMRRPSPAPLAPYGAGAPGDFAGQTAAALPPYAANGPAPVNPIRLPSRPWWPRGYSQT